MWAGGTLRGRMAVDEPIPRSGRCLKRVVGHAMFTERHIVRVVTMVIALRRLWTRPAAALLVAALTLGVMAPPASAYPDEDAGYLDYAEMVAAIHELAASNPQIAELFSIGRSFQGRAHWAAQVSANVDIEFSTTLLPLRVS